MFNDSGRTSRRAPLPKSLVSPVRRVLPKQQQAAVVPSVRGGIVDWAYYENGHRMECNSLDEAYERAQGSAEAFVWVGLHQPPDEEFHSIAERFSLHPLAIEDAIHAHQRPKVEVYGDSLFTVLKTVRYVDRDEVVETGEIMLFVSDDFVVSVRHGTAAALAEVRRDLEARPEVLAAGSSAVLWAVADRVVDGYEDAIAGLEVDIEQIESAVFDARAASPTERVYKLKREILEFRRAVDPLDRALGLLAECRVPCVDARTAEYFRDVHDHALRDASRLAAFDELLTSVLQANLAQVTLRQNEDMRRITAWAAILAAITSIAGVYGMNFEHMPELGWRYGYFICLGVMLAVSLSLYAAFKRKKWL